MKRLSPLLALTLAACAGPRVVPSSELVAALDQDARTEVTTTISQFLGTDWEKARINCQNQKNSFIAINSHDNEVDIPLAEWEVDLCRHDPPAKWLEPNTRLYFEKHGGWELVKVG